MSDLHSNDVSRADDLASQAKAATEAMSVYLTSVKTVQRRDGAMDAFDPNKLEGSIRRAFESAGLFQEGADSAIRVLTEYVLSHLNRVFDGYHIPSTSDIREAVNFILRTQAPWSVAVAYFEIVAPQAQALEVSTPQTVHIMTPPVVSSSESKSRVALADVQPPRRRRLPDERRSMTHKFEVGSHQGYVTVGLYDDGSPGEIFLTMSKEGSVMSGLADAFATSISIGLQYGVPLKTFVSKFAHMRFEPSGATQNPNLPTATSIVDYIFRWLALKFLTPEERQTVGIHGETIGGELSVPSDIVGLHRDRQASIGFDL